MSRPDEPLHQPPNPDDLRRAPPANAACAQVRGWLRDFADGDLEPESSLRLEEHVHHCRACSLELARAEHEVLRLRRAFAAAAPNQPQGPRPGFAARVVTRLVLDETSLLSGEDLANAELANGELASARASARRGTDAPSPHQADPADAGARMGLARTSGSERGSRWRTGAAVGPLLALSLLVGLSLVGLGSLLLAWASGDAAPERVARLVVTAADATFGDRGRLRSGDGLGELQSLWVKGGGAASLDWHDLSAQEQPAATLQVRGAGELRLQNGAPLLINGEVEVQTRRPVSIPMADGSQINLGIGEYVISAELADDPPRNRSQQSLNPLAFAPDDLLVQLEVVRGDDATVVRSHMGPTLVSLGHVGIYQGSSSVVMRPSGQIAASSGGGNSRVDSEQPAVDYGTFRGHVIDRSGLPSDGAVVLAAFTCGGVPQLIGLTTLGDGSFSQQTNARCDGKFAILQGVPPAARQDLGVTAPDAYALQNTGPDAALAVPLVLDTSLPFLARVVDDEGQPWQHVHVLPCVVDELFGDVWSPISPDTQTDANGAFRLERLPNRLPYHQHLVLLLLHPDLAPTVVAIPPRGSPVTLSPSTSFVAPRLRAVRLSGLAPNATLSLWEEIPGLPPAVAVWQRSVATDAQGRAAAAEVGRGRLWWRVGNPSNPFLYELDRDDQAPPPVGGVPALPSYRPVGEPVHHSLRFRGPLLSPGHYDLRLAASYRHSQLRVPAFPNATGQPLRVLDESGKTVEGAQVFAVAPSGPRGLVDQKFLGLTSSLGVVSLEAMDNSGDDVFIIGPDGTTARVLAQDLVGSVTTTLVRCGRVNLHESLRPAPGSQQDVVRIEFERLTPEVAGMAPVAVRFASSATDWEVGDLPPGVYRARIGEWVRDVTVPTIGFAILQ